MIAGIAATLLGTAVAAEPLAVLREVDFSKLRLATIERFRESHFVRELSVVTVDINALRQEIRSTAALADPTGGRPLLFRLVANVQFTLNPRIVEYHHSGNLAGTAFWGGGETDGTGFPNSVSFNLNENDELEATFRTAIGRIRIEPSDELPFHFVWLQDYEAEQEAQRSEANAL